MKPAVTPQEKNENFSQIANVLIQGYPELDIQDRYVPIALASVCWEEKFYPLSLRQIASITRVNHTALRSRAGQHPREGVLDRLKRVGILDFREEKPVDSTTGKEGRSQTYICIRYSNIWKENTKFFTGKKAVKIAASVDVVNSDTNTSVDGDNTSVDQNNHTVDVVNVSVDVVNHTVDGACSNAAHNTSNTKKTINTIEDSMAVSAIAPTPALSLSENTSLSYSHSQPATDLQEKGIETVVQATSVGYMQESTHVNPPEKPKRGTSKPVVEQQALPLHADLGPLVMPASDAAWPNAEIVVAISEVLRERRYTPKAKEEQLTAARKMFKEFPGITRAQFEKAFTQRNDAWWREHVGLLTIADLMAKDNSKAIRLSKILERLDTKPANDMKSPGQHQHRISPNSTGETAKVPDEIAQRNIARMKERAAQARAAQAEKEKAEALA